MFLGPRYPAFFRELVLGQKKNPGPLFSRNPWVLIVSSGLQNGTTITHSFGQKTTPTSTRAAIQQHERIVRVGASHCDSCRACQAPPNAFKYLRFWLRDVRFSEFDPSSQAHVVQSVKITIARFVCTHCQYTWTDYPDFRPSS